MVGDVADRQNLVYAIKTRGIEAIMHFAALIEAGESMRTPERYFQNNTAATSKSALARIEGWEKMDTTSQWDTLKVALQREAEDIFYSAGEVVLIEPSGISEFELLVISRTKHIKIFYVPERSTVRWETPNEYGFEPMSEPVVLLAATLMRLVYRR